MEEDIKIKTIKCTLEEQEKCDVEKRGCEGCYYNSQEREMKANDRGRKEIIKYI